MGMRIRVLSGCLALGATAVILTGTAAHATSLAGAHPTVVTTVSTNNPDGKCPSWKSDGTNDCGNCQGGNSYGCGNCQPGVPWNNGNGGCQPNPCQTRVYDENNGGSGYESCKPTSTPPCTCQKTPPPAYTPPQTVTVTPTQTMPVPLVTTSSAPAVAPVTGGGGSVGGGGGPLAVGGVATALVAGLIGTFAFRRWRRTRSPAA